MAKGSEDTLAILIDLQRQMAELTTRIRKQDGKKARRRGKQIAYSPPRDLPGPVPSELDIAHARRVLRGLR